jgi:hypothetical protein
MVELQQLGPPPAYQIDEGTGWNRCSAPNSDELGATRAHPNAAAISLSIRAILAHPSTLPRSSSAASQSETPYPQAKLKTQRERASCVGQSTAGYEGRLLWILRGALFVKPFAPTSSAQPLMPQRIRELRIEKFFKFFG